MTDDPHRPRAAVVGAGISGLTAAYLLSRTHHVTLFEAEDRLGGHTHTHTVPTTSGGDEVAVDTGFIVMNDRTYPTLERLFTELEVEVRPTEMSMSVTCDGCGLGFVGGRGAAGIFAQRRRVLDPRFLRFLLAVRRFQEAANALLDAREDEAAGVVDGSLTYGEFLDQHGFDRHFVAHYALPVVSCVWSMGHEQALAYPAAYLFAFLRHHGFLALRDAPQWYTVVGGSSTYVGRIRERLDAVHTGAAVRAVRREEDGVEVTDVTGATHRFDKLVVATHADQALALLSDADAREKELLGSFGYSTNEVLLHRDESVLPTQRRARAAWNYRLASCDEVADRSRVSYWMNRLQGHPESAPLVVTLNADEGRRPAEVIEQMTYQHPTYTRESVAAQAHLAELNTDRVAFAGAYHGWGFHEDGCRSGVAAAEALGATW